MQPNILLCIFAGLKYCHKLVFVYHKAGVGFGLFFETIMNWDYINNRRPAHGKELLLRSVSCTITGVLLAVVLTSRFSFLDSPRCYFSSFFIKFFQDEPKS